MQSKTLKHQIKLFNLLLKVKEHSQRHGLGCDVTKQLRETQELINLFQRLEITREHSDEL